MISRHPFLAPILGAVVICCCQVPALARSKEARVTILIPLDKALHNRQSILLDGLKSALKRERPRIGAQLQMSTFLSIALRADTQLDLKRAAVLVQKSLGRWLEIASTEKDRMNLRIKVKSAGHARVLSALLHAGMTPGRLTVSVRGASEQR